MWRLGRAYLSAAKYHVLTTFIREKMRLSRKGKQQTFYLAIMDPRTARLP